MKLWLKTKLYHIKSNFVRMKQRMSNNFQTNQNNSRIKKFKYLRKDIFYNSLTLGNLNRFYDGYLSHEQLVIEIDSLYEEWNSSPNDFVYLKHPELLKDLKDFGEIPSEITNQEIWKIKDYNKNLKKEILKPDIDFYNSFNKRFINTTYKVLPLLFVIGGFIRAVIFSNILKINIPLLFRLEDYWNLGVSSFAEMIPILLLMLIFSLLHILLWKPRRINFEKREYKPYPRRFSDGLSTGLMLAISTYTTFTNQQAWNKTIFILLFLSICLVLWVLSDSVINFTHLIIPIVFLISIPISAYYQINYVVENRIESEHYYFQSDYEIPETYGYVFSTSDYHIFKNRNSTVLIPTSDVKQIEIINKNEEVSLSELFLKKITKGFFDVLSKPKETNTDSNKLRRRLTALLAIEEDEKPSQL